MVTILYRQRHGYDVRIHSDDHEPAHAHVFKIGNRVRVFLDPISFDENHGFNNREPRKIRRLTELHLELLRDHWEIIHR